jgi:hypothetical protein
MKTLKLSKDELDSMHVFAESLEAFSESAAKLADNESNEGLMNSVVNTLETLSATTEKFAAVFVKMFPSQIDDRPNGLHIETLRKLKYGAMFFVMGSIINKDDVGADKAAHFAKLLIISKMKQVAGGVIVAVRHYIKSIEEKGGLQNVERKKPRVAKPDTPTKKNVRKITVG